MSKALCSWGSSYSPYWEILCRWSEMFVSSDNTLSQTLDLLIRRQILYPTLRAKSDLQLIMIW